MLLGARATLEQLERALEPVQGCFQVGPMLDIEAVRLVYVVQQLESVPNVFGGSLCRPVTPGGIATIEGAAALGAAPQIHDAAAIDRDQRQDRATRDGAAVDAAATLSKQTAGQRHDLICHQWRVGATRNAVV